MRHRTSCNRRVVSTLPAVRRAALVVVVLVLGVGSAQAEPPSRNESVKVDSAVDFARDVQPILATKCVRCHGPGKAEGGLRLDASATARAKLESGAHAIVPGRVDESELLKRVAADDGARMPPEGERLTAGQIEALRGWIASGAAWPEHWAYRPLVAPAVPSDISAEGAAWARTPIDRFVWRALEERGLRPAPEADRRTLMRRLQYDLLGLPPSPEEIDAFIADPAPDAYERLVERLLASPQYGERWARHWMDVVHYADTHGFEHDIAREIWPYRDWLVRAFNDDMPYARFVREQVAGDVLGNGDPDALVATGFLATGPWDLSALQAGNMDSIDHTISQYLDRDDIVSTVMGTFVSTTAHCARCHDHKFDPVSQTDYYSLQAVFAGIDKGTRKYDPDPAVATRRRDLSGQLAAIPTRRAANDPTLLAADVAAKVAAYEARRRERKSEWQPVDPVEFTSANGATLTEQPDHSILSSGKKPETDIVTIVARPAMKLVTAVKLEVLTDDSLPHKGPGRQDNGNLHLNELVVTVASVGENGAVDTAAAKPVMLVRPKADFDQDGGWSIDKALDKNAATAWGIYPKVGVPHVAVFELAEPMKLDGPTDWRFELRQTHGGGHLIGRARISLGDMPPPLPLESAPLPAEIAAALDVSPEQRTDEQRRLLAAHVVELELTAALAALPEQRLLYCGTNQFKPEGGHRPAPKPRPIHLLKRGDIATPGPLAVPGALSCVPGLPGTFPDLGHDEEAPRRAALAHWLADERNVLTWRSIANRVWQFHFGRGLVDTPSDFGRMGGAPSHPELLDWLAARVRGGGSGAEGQGGTGAERDGATEGRSDGETERRSDRGRAGAKHDGLTQSNSPSSSPPISSSLRPSVSPSPPAPLPHCPTPNQQGSLKDIHRLLVTSAAYRQSSRHDARAAAVDGDNRLLWRMNRRRLDGESVRDTILAITGQLDTTFGGPPIKQFLETRKFGLRAEADYQNFPIDHPGNRRRSIYRYVYRTIPDPLMAALDCPDGTQFAPRRTESITALQALATLNDKFVVRQSERLADRIAAELPADAALERKAAEAWRRVLGRAATPDERAAVAAYASQHGLANAVRFLLNTNEFLFVD